MQLAELYGVTTDELLRDDSEAPPPPPAKRRWLIPTAAGAVVLLLLLFGLVRSRQDAAQLTEENSALTTAAAGLEERLKEAETALTEERTGEPRTFEELSAYYYAFAQEYRLDYLPEFPAGDPPTESPAYLYYAFMLNFDNWGDQKGTMSKEYVDDVVRTHFNLPGVAHMPMWKGWDFDGTTYTALPGGVNPVPVYFLHSYKTYTDEYKTYHEVILDEVSLRENGYVDPAAENLLTLDSLLAKYDRDEFITRRQQKIVYYLSREKPVFVEHEGLFYDPMA